MIKWQIVFGLVVAFLLGCAAVDVEPGEDTATRSEAVTHPVVIQASVPADAPVVYVAGNLPELGPWHPAALKMAGDGTSRSVTIQVPHGHNLQYKITAGSWEQEGLGPSATVLPSFTATITEPVTLTAAIAGFRTDPVALISDWRGSGVKGDLTYWTDVTSTFLEETRHVVVWTPPDYAAHPDRDYAVIYMHDGQNLFDPRLSYTNIDWGVDEAMMKGAEEGLFEPAIVVGIWNTAARLKEYSPDHLAPQYARFLIEELMPRVEQDFRVKRGPEHTFTMGSSMGAIVSFYLVRDYPEVFSGCGCLSTHITWSEQQIAWYNGEDPTDANPVPFLLRSLTPDAAMPSGQRLYFDYGTEGLDAHYEQPTQVLAQWLETQGYRRGDTLNVEKYDGADHNEAAWRARVGKQLTWLLAPRRP